VMVDGAEGDGSLKAVGGTHGVSPYCYNGVPSCVLFYRRAGIVATPARNFAGNHSPYLAHPPPHRAPTGERQGKLAKELLRDPLIGLVAGGLSLCGVRCAVAIIPGECPHRRLPSDSVRGAASLHPLARQHTGSHGPESEWHSRSRA